MTAAPTTAGPRPRPPATGRPQGASGTKAKATAIKLDPLKVIRQNIVLLVFGLIVGVGIGIGTFFFCHRYFPSYTASTIFECLPKVESVITEGETTRGSLDELEMFMKTQAFEITRDGILLEAVNTREVRTNTEWAKQFHTGSDYDSVEAFLELKEEIRCGAIPETSYLQLSMSGPVAADVPIIINAVAGVYARQLSQQKRSDSSDRRQQLDTELANLRTQRDQMEESMATFLAEHDISVLEELASAEALEVHALTSQSTQLETALDQTRQMRTMYEEIYAQEGIINYPDTIRLEAEEHPRIAALKNQGVTMRALLRSASDQFGPNHREVRALQRQIRALDDEIGSEELSLMESLLSARLDSTRQSEQQFAQSISEINVSLNEARVRLRDLTSNLQSYNQMSEEMEGIQEQHDKLEAKLRELRLTEESSASDRVQQRGRAATPEKVSFPKIETMVPGVTVLVTGLFVGFVFLREVIDQRVKSPADIMGVGKGKVLGIIPELREDPTSHEGFELAITRQPQSIIAETIRQIRTPVLKGMQAGDLKVVLVVAAAPVSGSTSVIGNLAASCAALEMKVLIVDGNYRKPRVHKHFDGEVAPGLSDLLAEQVSFDDCVQATAIEHLSILPAGNREHRIVERLGTQRFDRVMTQAKESFDLILVDVAPGIVAGDAQLIANRVDASLLIARAMQDKRGLVARVAGLLQESKSEFLGVVINGVRSSAGGYYRKNIQAMSKYRREDSEVA
jgi:polysaccharide biosynthesis transport protein